MLPDVMGLYFRTVDRATTKPEGLRRSLAQTTTSIPRRSRAWQLPFWTWLQRRDVCLDWPTVISAVSNSSSIMLPVAHSLRDAQRSRV